MNKYPPISGYEYLQYIGNGSRYRVYEARSLSTGTRVCLKVITCSARFAEELAETWRHEAQELATLDHPNIVRLVEVREAREDGVIFYATEYVKGVSLAETISRRGPVPFAEVIRIASQVAAALEHAHTRDVVHANLRPRNILIGEAGEVVLKGFGTPYAIRSGGVVILDSVHYLAPEQLAKAAKPVPQTDIYSLAEVVFHLLTGMRRFENADMRELFESKKLRKVTGARGPRQTLSGGVALVLERALAFRPEDRYESALQFINALELASHQESPRWWNVWR